MNVTIRATPRLTIRFVSALLLFAANSAYAKDPPKTERIFPPGGQIGTQADVKLFGKPGTLPLQAWTARNELSFTLSKKGDSAEVTVPKHATPGVHWVRFFNQHGTIKPVPFVVGIAPESEEAEPNNSPRAAQLLRGPTSTVNGVLAKSGDVDVFGFELKQGQTLVASLAAGRLNSPMDAVLQILNPRGTVVSHNDDDRGFDPLATVTATEDGTYYVRTFAFPSTPNSTIRLAGAANYVYRLTLTCDQFVTHSVPLSVPTASNSVVRLHGWNLPQDSQQLLPAHASGQHIVAHKGPIPVTVPTTDFAVFSEDELREKPLPIPSKSTGTISEPGQIDAFRFSGREGQSLKFTIDARVRDSLLDPVLKVSSSKKLVKELDDRSRSDMDAEATIRLPANDEYVVEIADRFQSGSPRHFYELTIEEALPDLELSVAKDAYVLKTAEPLEIPVTIQRTRSFAKEIAFTIEGLPEHVTLEPAVSVSNGETAKKVTLKLTATNGAHWSGPITIVGTSGPTSRLVTTKIDQRQTSHLWLTIPETRKPLPNDS